jgi:hypothetical protein
MHKMHGRLAKILVAAQYQEPYIEPLIKSQKLITFLFSLPTFMFLLPKHGSWKHIN